MPAPSIAVYKDAYTELGTVVTTRALAERTVASGDVVAVVVQQESWSTTTGYQVASVAMTAGTAVIGAVTFNRDAGAASRCNNALFTFTVTSGGTLTLTVTFTKNGTPGNNRNTIWTFVATGCGGVGNTALLTSGGSTSLATSDQSVVIAMAADWNAVGAATTTLTPAGAESPVDAHETDGVVDQSTSGSVFSSRGGHWASVGAGTVTYGVSAPSSSTYNVVVCELLAGTGGGGTDSGPNYAGTATDLGGGSGSWTNPTYAQGGDDASYATWAVP
jgi:hypothetical protein